MPIALSAVNLPLVYSHLRPIKSRSSPPPPSTRPLLLELHRPTDVPIYTSFFLHHLKVSENRNDICKKCYFIVNFCLVQNKCINAADWRQDTTHINSRERIAPKKGVVAWGKVAGMSLWIQRPLQTKQVEGLEGFLVRRYSSRQTNDRSTYLLYISNISFLLYRTYLRAASDT